MKDELQCRTSTAMLRKKFFEKIYKKKTNIDTFNEGYDYVDLIEYNKNVMEKIACVFYDPHDL